MPKPNRIGKRAWNAKCDLVHRRLHEFEELACRTYYNIPGDAERLLEAAEALRDAVDDVVKSRDGLPKTFMLATARTP